MNVELLPAGVQIGPDGKIRPSTIEVLTVGIRDRQSLDDFEQHVRFRRDVKAGRTLAARDKKRDTLARRKPLDTRAGRRTRARAIARGIREGGQQRDWSSSNQGHLVAAVCIELNKELKKAQVTQMRLGKPCPLILKRSTVLNYLAGIL